MKTKIIFAVVLIIISSLIVFLWSVSFRNPHSIKQAELANYLQVQIEDFPYQYSFPVGYFYSVLRPGMTVDEVHSIVKGYEKVLNCGASSEIYYYFSTEDSNALRLEIYYTSQGTYEDIMGEDNNSSTLWTEGCISGLIER